MIDNSKIKNLVLNLRFDILHHLYLHHLFLVHHVHVDTFDSCYVYDWVY